ncbi:hypothetical protein BGZ74_003693 [Mortierella antarctica]|nr:hypothetical protein BGZ74_003693 [Mortierella antarctica]
MSKSTMCSTQPNLNEPSTGDAPEEHEDSEETEVPKVPKETKEPNETETQKDGILCKVITMPASLNLPKVPTPVPAPQSHSVEEVVLQEQLHCSKCSPVVEKEFAVIITNSPYLNAICSQKYTELTPDLCKFLNRDWVLSPHLQFTCVRFLTGCILYQKDWKHMVIMNGIEVHAGATIAFKNQLIIGTQSFDALISSLIHLNHDFVLELHSVGASTMNFELALDKSLGMLIFIDHEYVQQALAIAEDKEAWNTDGSCILGQLHQLRTKFHDLSTYYLCRSLSHFS